MILEKCLLADVQVMIFMRFLANCVMNV